MSRDHARSLLKRPARALLWLLGMLCAWGGCSSEVTQASPPAQTSQAEPESPVPAVRHATLRITRIVLYDDHPTEPGMAPRTGSDTENVVFDYSRRAPDARPVIRRYTATIVVPSDRPRSWDLAMGDDYRLLVMTETFARDGDAINVKGRVISNYQTQLGPESAIVGPNHTYLEGIALPVGKSVALEVLQDEIKGRVFREYMELEVEAIDGSQPASVSAGIDENADAQKRRSETWTSVRKATLR